MWITVPKPAEWGKSGKNNLLNPVERIVGKLCDIHNDYESIFLENGSEKVEFTKHPQPFNSLSTFHEQSYTHIFFLMISMLFFSSSLEESSSAILLAP